MKNFFFILANLSDNHVIMYLVFMLHALHKKWSFPLRISSVNGPNPQETADLVHLLKKSVMENFIFCAVMHLKFLLSVLLIRIFQQWFLNFYKVKWMIHKIKNKRTSKCKEKMSHCYCESKHIYFNSSASSALSFFEKHIHYLKMMFSLPKISITLLWLLNELLLIT